MNKNTKILLGLGAVAAVGYFIWKNNSPKANATGRGDFNTEAWQKECTSCYTMVQDLGNGDFVYTCKNGNHATKIKNGVKKC